MAPDEQIIWNNFLFAHRNKIFIKQITLFKYISRHRCHSDFFVSGSSRNLQTCAVSKCMSSPSYLGHILAEYHVLGLTWTRVLDICYSFVQDNLIWCQPHVIIRLTGMLSLIHVELLRETKSIYLYSN